MQRRRVLSILRIAAQLLAIAFVVWTVWRVSQEWNGLPAGVPVWAIALAGLASLTSNFVQALAWHSEIEFLSGKALPWPLQLRVFLASNLGRYMPGKVGLLTVRITASTALGLDPLLVTSATLIEVLSWMTSAGLFAFAVLSVASPALSSAPTFLPVHIGAPLAGALCAAFALLALALVRVDRSRLPARLLRAGALAPTGPLVTPRMLLTHLLYWASWSVHGMALVLGFGASPLSAFGASAAFVLGPVIGFLALLAPAGAGVREAVLISLVSPVTGVASSVAIGLLSRVLSLGGDVIAWLMSLALERWAGPAAAAAAPPQAERD
jgi:glycosyltransferase 2 family protein